MRQFLKKRVPTFLLTLVMVMTMVPAVSAKSSDITYSVKPGDSATFSVSDFSDYYDKYCSGTFEHVEFSVSRSDYSDLRAAWHTAAITSAEPILSEANFMIPVPTLTPTATAIR